MISAASLAASLNDERAPDIEGGGLTALTSSCSLTGTYRPL